MKAKIAAMAAYAIAKEKWPDDAKGMSTMMMSMIANLADCSYGTHNYIPQDKLNQELGLPNGAGVFAYYKFDDDSYVLLTCNDGLAIWKNQTVEFYPSSNPIAEISA